MARTPISLAVLVLGLGVAALGAFSTGCGPLYENEVPRVAPPAPSFVTVYTDNPRYFYLIDTDRALCYFGDRRYPQLTAIDCARLPEARRVLGWPEPEGPTPWGAPEDEALEGEAPGQEPLEEAEPPSPATSEERQRFEAAYVEIFCAQRRGEDGPPDEEAILEGHDLTVARYHEIRDEVAGDAEAWSALSREALEACPAPPDDEE